MVDLQSNYLEFTCLEASFPYPSWGLEDHQTFKVLLASAFHTFITNPSARISLSNLVNRTYLEVAFRMALKIMESCQLVDHKIHSLPLLDYRNSPGEEVEVVEDCSLVHRT